MRKLICITALVVLSLHATDNCSNLPAYTTLADNGFARTPPMGWNTWYPIGAAALSESGVKTQTDLLVSTGLAAAGYNYVMVDDGWPSASRTGGGDIQADATKFPSGMASLATYVHGKGLKFGLYSSPYTTTCGGYMGSGLHEAADAATFASWGVDFLKYDGCSVNLLYASCTNKIPVVYQWMAQSIRATGRDIVMLMGTTPLSPWLFGRQEGYNMWRYNQQDLNNTWSLFDPQIDLAAGLTAYQFPGAWNDPDFLASGTPTWISGSSFTATQRKTQFGLVALWGGPLILGMPLASLSGGDIAQLSNPEVIALDQDSAGVMASRLSSTSCGSATCEVWIKRLHDGSWGVGLLNRDSASHSVSVDYTMWYKGGNSLATRDLWAGTDLGSMTSYSTTVAGYGLALLKLTGSSSVVNTRRMGGKAAVVGAVH